MVRRFPGRLAGRIITALALVAASACTLHSASRPPSLSDAVTTSTPAVQHSSTSTSTTTTTTTTTTTPATTVAPTTTFPDNWQPFDAAQQSAIMQPGTWAMSVAVARDGIMVHRAAFGTSDPSTRAPATVNDRYRLASVSKALTAIAVMQLVESHRLGLDQPVIGVIARHLGVAPIDPAMGAVTVRQLLAHTSGIGDSLDVFFTNPAASCASAAALALARPLAARPGTRYIYSNMNYCLLGLLVSYVRAMAYRTSVLNGVLAPLGINDMRLAGTTTFRAGDVHYPASAADGSYMEALASSGAWVGTPTDLVKIIDSLDTNRTGFHPLGAASVAAMVAKDFAENVDYPTWSGLGMESWSDGSWGHGGNLTDVKALVVHRPDGLTWSVMVAGAVPYNVETLHRIVAQALARVGIGAPSASTATTTTSTTLTTPST